MTDIFSKACLAVIAVSLGTLAYLDLSDHLAGPGAEPQSPNKQTALSPSSCIGLLSELRDTDDALEAQLRNVPAMVREKDANGTVISEKPNRLYEQLMTQLIETRLQQASTMEKCGA